MAEKRLSGLIRSEVRVVETMEAEVDGRQPAQAKQVKTLL